MNVITSKSNEVLNNATEQAKRKLSQVKSSIIEQTLLQKLSILNDTLRELNGQTRLIADLNADGRPHTIHSDTETIVANATHLCVSHIQTILSDLNEVS